MASGRARCATPSGQRRRATRSCVPSERASGERAETARRSSSSERAEAAEARVCPVDRCRAQPCPRSGGQRFLVGFGDTILILNVVAFGLGVAFAVAVAFGEAVDLETRIQFRSPGFGVATGPQTFGGT